MLEIGRFQLFLDKNNVKKKTILKKNPSLILIMYAICFDLEGVFTPEVWINVALKTGIEELKLTTRDEPDYDKLMTRRLQILKEHNITLSDIQEVISQMDLLPGAKNFLDWVRERIPACFILSDTFEEFGMQFMKKLGYPNLLCHKLEVDSDDMITGYKIRINDQKKKTVLALKMMNYEVIAAGDSYNDTHMLKEAKHGILFRPPQNVIDEFPQFPVVTEYEDFKKYISEYLQE